MRRRWAAGIGLMTVIFLAACGGGGGSSSPYTGLTTPAVIDTTNAREIALGAYYGGEMSDTSFMPDVLARQAPEFAAPPVKVVALVKTLMNLTDSLEVQQPAAAKMGQVSPMREYYDSWREPGAISGYVDISLAWDDQTGGFHGTFSFHDCDDGDGAVFSGTIRVSGTTSIYYDPNPYPGDILEVTFRFSSFTATDGIDAIRISGTMVLDTGIPDRPAIARMNLYLKYLTTDKTAWIRNYEITVTVGSDIGGSYAEMEIVGRIYLHDYGYVDIATVAPFRVYDTALYPSSGVLIVTGKDDCKARLTVISDPTYDYRVELDEDGNDVYEWSIEGIWT